MAHFRMTTLQGCAARRHSARCVDSQNFWLLPTRACNSTRGLLTMRLSMQITRSNPRFIEEHEKPFKLPWFSKIMISIAVIGFVTVGTLLLGAFFSGHLGMMSVTRGDLAKLAAVSGVPGVKQSHLLKAALGQAKDSDADMSVYGTRLPKARMHDFIHLPKHISVPGEN